MKRILTIPLYGILAWLVIGTIATYWTYGFFHPDPILSEKHTNNWQGCFNTEEWEKNRICSDEIVCVDEGQCREFLQDPHKWFLRLGFFVLGFFIWFSIHILRRCKEESR